MPFSLPTATHAGKPWRTLQVSISQEAFWGWRRLEDMQLKALLATSGIEAIMGWCSIITRQSLSRGPVHPAAHWLWQQSLGTFPLHRPEHCWAQMTFVTGKKQRTKKMKNISCTCWNDIKKYGDRVWCRFCARFSSWDILSSFKAKVWEGWERVWVVVEKGSCSACNYLDSYEVLRTLIPARKYALLRKNNPVTSMPRPSKTLWQSHLIAGQQDRICLHFTEKIYYYWG